MEYIEVSAKTVEDAISEAAIKLEVPSDKIEYEVITEGSTGFLGLIGSKPAVIKARKKFNLLDHTKDFLARLFKAMNVDVNSTVDYDEESRTMNIVFDGEDMGLLIGKRGQTLDSLQYIISLVVNKESDSYIRIKVDTENYRERRKATLENLAKNLAYKVKRTRRPVSLEPMNPYERRVIHSVLQNDRYVETHSEGEEPYRKVVITLKKDYRREVLEVVTTVRDAIIVKIIITAREAIEENVLTAVKKLKDLRRIMSITIVMIMSDAGSTPEAFLNV